jgi:type I restriction enzyme S subunit
MAAWKTVTLGDVCEVSRGGSPRPINKFITEDGSGLNWIKIGDASSSSIYITKTKQKIRPEGLKKTRQVYPGDLILSNSMSFGRPYILKIDGCIHDGWLLIRDINNLFDKKFLCYALGTPQMYAQFKRLAVGGVVNNLNSALVRGVKIPIPPHDDQIRIATLLNSIEALIVIRKESIDELDKFLISTFLDMFGDPIRNEKKWETDTVDNLLSAIESGWSPKCEAFPATKEAWGVLKLGAVTKCQFNESENKQMLPAVAPKPEKEVKAGDLLFSRKNTYELVAASAYIFSVRPKLMLSDLIFRLQVKDTERLNPVFLWKLLINDRQRSRIQSLAGGAAGSMPNISKTKLKSEKIIVPDQKLQNKFVSIVLKVESLKTRYQESLTELENLYGAVSQKAFKGELDLSRISLPDNLEILEPEPVSLNEALKRITNNLQAFQFASRELVNLALPKIDLSRINKLSESVSRTLDAVVPKQFMEQMGRMSKQFAELTPILPKLDKLHVPEPIQLPVRNALTIPSELKRLTTFDDSKFANAFKAIQPLNISTASIPLAGYELPELSVTKGNSKKKTKPRMPDPDFAEELDADKNYEFLKIELKRALKDGRLQAPFSFEELKNIFAEQYPFRDSDDFSLLLDFMRRTLEDQSPCLKQEFGVSHQNLNSSAREETIIFNLLS